MSYCRWSSMNWRCDVYVYEDVSGGWTTHVAGKRRRWAPIPDLPLLSMPRWLMWLWVWWHNQLHLRTLDWIPLRPIGLRCDGMTFNDPTPERCASRLVVLRHLGYIVPQYVIDELQREEVDERD